MQALLLIGLIISFVTSYFITEKLINLFHKKKLYAKLDERSNHLFPTPVGGGVAVVFAFLIGCIPIIVLYPDFIKISLIFFMALLGLVVISFIDDLFHTSVLLRFVVHIIAAVIASVIILDIGPILGRWIPYWMDFIILSFCIVGFLNMFNFMDGIDGLTGMEAIHISISVAITLLIMNEQEVYIYICLLVALVCLGFLVHNWHYARIFIGDVGSISIGYVLAVILSILAVKGYWLQVLILPMYYIIDSGSIIIKRMVKGEKFWLPHSEHFFQRAVRAGISHAEVVIKISICNFFLSCLSLASIYCYGYSIIIKIMILFIAVLLVMITIHLLPKKNLLLDWKIKR